MKSHLAALTALAVTANCLAISPSFAANAPISAPAVFKDVPSAPGPSTFVQDHYSIGPQDTLEVTVFQVEDLSRTVRVESTGTILLPLIGQIMAGGRTPEQLSDEIAAELSKTYMKDPLVTVTVKESSNQRVTVDGAVIQPGIYPISGNTTLTQAIALARGPSDIADLREIAIFRNDGKQLTTAMFNLSSIRAGKMADPAVMANDVIVVEISGGRRFLQTLGNFVPFLQLVPHL